MNKLQYYNRSLANLSLLRGVGLTSLDLSYCCPLCMNTFSQEKAKQELTEEDVPQKSLGGQRITLTCKQCNSSCGANIDIYLLNSIKGMEQRAFLTGTDRNVSISKGENRLHATLKVGESGNMLLNIDTKRNNPKTWAFYHDNVLLENSVINIQDDPLKQSIRRYSAAILKNAYLILFARTGYTFLADSFYDRLRRQILNSEPYVLPERLWTFQNVSVPDGIYLAGDNRYRGFFVVYSLQLQKSYKVCVLLPTPNVEYSIACIELRKISSNSKIQVVLLPPNQDYMCNEDNVIKLRKWVYGWELNL